jgi:shikimate kinase
MAEVFVIAGAAGSGKTTFGRALSVRLGVPLLDLDEATAGVVEAFRVRHPELDEAAALTAVRDDRYVELQRATERVISTGSSAIVTAPFTAEIASRVRWRDWIAPLGDVPVHLMWIAVTPEERLRRMRVRGSSRDAHLVEASSETAPLPEATAPVVEYLRLDARHDSGKKARIVMSHFGNASRSI